MVRLIEILLVLGVANYVRPAPVNTESWDLLPHKFIDISTKGTELWAVDRFNSVYRYMNNQWTSVPMNLSSGSTMNGKPVGVAASPDGWSWMITDLNSIYRWNVTAGQWNQIVGLASQINAINRDKAVVVQTGEVWTYTYEQSKFDKVAFNGRAIWAAIGENDERWMIDDQYYIYRWNLNTKEFDRMPGMEAASIDVQNAERILATTKTGRVYFWKDGRWQQIPNIHAHRATLNRDTIYFSDEMENAYQSKGDIQTLLPSSS